MLLPNNKHLLRYSINETLAQYRREAEVDRLLDEICPHRPSKLADQVCRALQNLGHVFVALGRRLEAQPGQVHTNLTS